MCVCGGTGCVLFRSRKYNARSLHDDNTRRSVMFLGHPSVQYRIDTLIFLLNEFYLHFFAPVRCLNVFLELDSRSIIAKVCSKRTFNKDMFVLKYIKKSNCSVI